jgi:hypothetical protein
MKEETTAKNGWVGWHAVRPGWAKFRRLGAFFSEKYRTNHLGAIFLTNCPKLT